MGHMTDFKIAFESFPGVHVLLLPDPPKYTIAAVTNDHLVISGKNRDELIGIGLFEAFPPNPGDSKGDGVQNLSASFQKVLHTKMPDELPAIRYDIKNKEGIYEERFWSARNKPVLNDEGNITYIIHSSVDTTQQVTAERREVEMKDIEKTFNLFMQAPVIIAVIKGNEHIIELANEGMLKVWGRSKEVVGKPLLEAIPELEGQGYIELLEKVRKTGQPYYAYETPTTLVRNGTEEVLYFDFVYQPYFENEKESIATGVIGVAHDVTEQVRSRQRFKNVLEQAKDPILIFKGEEMTLDVANEALLKIWNVDQTAIGKTFLEILPEMKDQGFLELLQEVFHTGKPFQGYEVPAVFKEPDGTSRTVYFNFTYQPYREADGTITGVLVLASDVTGQVEAKHKLVESERNLRNTIMQAPVAMCILKGPSFIVEVANDRMYSLWGKGADALLGKPIFEGLFEAKDQGFEALLSGVYTSGESYSASEVPVTLPRQGGIETVFINFVYEPFRDGDGSVAGVIAVAIDVTELVKARKKAEDNEEQFRTLANSIFQLAWMANPDGWIHWYNDRWYEYTGTTLEEMQGWGWQKVHHPDHIERVVNFVKEAWNRPEPFELTFPLRRHDGAYRWFLTRVYPVRNSEGAVVQWIGTNTDIDEHKQVEALLEEKVGERTRELENQKSLFDNILQNSSNGISVTEMVRDENGAVIDAVTILANEAAVNFTGLPREIYLTKRATELDPEIFNTPYGQTCLKTLETGEPSFIQYYLEVTSRWLELTISKMDDDHLIHIFTDVTPIKEAQLQLERTVGELQRSKINLEEFAYAASHDLKEPVRKIHFFNDRLRTTLKDKANDEERHLFERMEMATKRMSSLIDDLLSYSQVSLRPRTFDNVDLNQIIDLVLNDLDLEIEEKRAKINVEKLLTVKGHHRQLQQAFQNLISNALKYNKTGETPVISIDGKVVKGKDLEVRVEFHDKEYYQVCVTDNGIGFEQKDVERIFNVFTRLHANTDYRGTGIGLSIVRKVIENHNGFITASSAPGEGATFKIYLPLENTSN